MINIYFEIFKTKLEKLFVCISITLCVVTYASLDQVRCLNSIWVIQSAIQMLGKGAFFFLDD